jgi:hypothetical protein
LYVKRLNPFGPAYIKLYGELSPGCNQTSTLLKTKEIWIGPPKKPTVTTYQDSDCLPCYSLGVTNNNGFNTTWHINGVESSPFGCIQYPTQPSSYPINVNYQVTVSNQCGETHRFGSFDLECNGYEFRYYFEDCLDETTKYFYMLGREINYPTLQESANPFIEVKYCNNQLVSSKLFQPFKR